MDKPATCLESSGMLWGQSEHWARSNPGWEFPTSASSDLWKQEMGYWNENSEWDKSTAFSPLVSLAKQGKSWSRPHTLYLGLHKSARVHLVVNRDFELTPVINSAKSTDAKIAASPDMIFVHRACKMLSDTPIWMPSRSNAIGDYIKIMRKILAQGAKTLMPFASVTPQGQAFTPVLALLSRLADGTATEADKNRIGKITGSKQQMSQLNNQVQQLQAKVSAAKKKQ